jgi:hypothetical protein
MKLKTCSFFTFFTFVLLAIVLWLATSLFTKVEPKPKEIGEFEYEGARTKVYLSGDCQIFATKWKNNENPNFFFSCADKRR